MPKEIKQGPPTLEFWLPAIRQCCLLGATVIKQFMTVDQAHQIHLLSLTRATKKGILSDSLAYEDEVRQINPEISAARQVLSWLSSSETGSRLFYRRREHRARGLHTDDFNQPAIRVIYPLNGVTVGFLFDNGLGSQELSQLDYGPGDCLLLAESEPRPLSFVLGGVSAETRHPRHGVLLPDQEDRYLLVNDLTVRAPLNLDQVQ
jgi:hypothetical protein